MAGWIEKKTDRSSNGHHPFARTDLASSLTSSQPYDISISLVLPRTPSNIATGNFMLDLALQPANASRRASSSFLQQVFDISEPVVIRSRRTAILTYTSPVVDLAQTLGRLPLYAFGWRKQRESIEVSMFEGVEFKRGASNIPDTALLVIEGDEKMQFYSAVIKIHTKFQGLRWILYNYKLTSFVVFTATFFGISILSTLLIYIAFALSGGGSEHKERIKQEIKSESPDEILQPEPRQAISASVTDGVSDDTEIKKEDFDGLEPSDINPLGGEADDEDEDGSTSAWRDSGIGTGREDNRDSSNRKRKSYKQAMTISREDSFNL